MVYWATAGVAAAASAAAMVAPGPHRRSINAAPAAVSKVPSSTPGPAAASGQVAASVSFDVPLSEGSLGALDGVGS